MSIRRLFCVISLGLAAGAPVGRAQVAKPTVSQVAKPTVQNGESCCAITSIDGETGIVTARVTATRRALAFKVTDTALLRSLHIGQAISADFPANRVAVYPGEPCCAIISPASAGSPATAAQPATSPAAKAPAAPAAAVAPAGLGSHPHEVSGVDVVLLSVQRTSGNTLTIRWEYRNKTGEPRKLGESFQTASWASAFSLVYDAYFLDGRTKYPVQSDQGGLTAARQSGGSVVTLAAKGTYATWARFGAPPATTTKISIFIPGTEPFENIAIGTGGSQTPPRQRR